jgi:hypothetical protein
MNSMTNEELRDLVAGLAVRHAELAEIQKETERQLQLTDRQLQETDRQVQETSKTVKETGQQIQRQFQETDRQVQETSKTVKETGQQIRELKRQLGGLGEKFGGFTEGMALPSMRKLLQQRFHMDVITVRALSRKNGSSMELDVLAHSKSKVNEVYIVEVKSHLRQEGIDQIKKTLREFHNYFPGHAGKKVYGILAVVDINDELRAKVLQEGIYLALIHDDEFELQVPDGFQPRAF